MSHFHAGHNDAGYLPEADVLCFESAGEALSYLASELDRAADDAAMGDESGDGEHPWPDINFVESFVQAERVPGSVTWGDALYQASRDGFALSVDDGRALPHVWWVEPAKFDRGMCELAAEQDDE